MILENSEFIITRSKGSNILIWSKAKIESGFLFMGFRQNYACSEKAECLKIEFLIIGYKYLGRWYF